MNILKFVPPTIFTMSNTCDNLHIVLADDDPEDMELLEEAIHSIEPAVNIHRFTNGISALNYLLDVDHNPPPCLVVFDYNMPQKNGAQLLLSLAQHPAYTNIPKIILSTSNAPLHMEECKRNGATDYLIKPFQLKEFYELAEKLVKLCRS